MAREKLVNATDLRTKLPEVLREVANRPVVILRNSRAEAAILAYDVYVKMLDTIDELEDRLAAIEGAEESEDMKIPFEKMKAELGLMRSK